MSNQIVGTVFPKARCGCAPPDLGILPALVASAKLVGSTAISQALNAVLGKKKDRDKEAWNVYRTLYGQQPGRLFDELSFELAWQGLSELVWDNWLGAIHRGVVDDPQLNPGGLAKNIPHWILYRVIRAVCDGVIKPDESAPAVFDRLIWPVISRWWPPQGGFAPEDKQVFVDWVDRVLGDVPIGETYNNQRHPHLKPSDILSQMCKADAVVTAADNAAAAAVQQAATGSTAVAPAPASVQTAVAQQVGPVDALLPSGLTFQQLVDDIYQIANKLAADPANRSLSFSELQSVAKDAAKQYLDSRGVPSEAAIDQTVEKVTQEGVASARFNWQPIIVGVGIGVGALLLFRLLGQRSRRAA